MDEIGNRYEFIWRIENFNSRLPKFGNVLYDSKCFASPRFSFYLCGNTEWYLEIYPRSGRNLAFLKCLPICSDYAKDSNVSIDIAVLSDSGLVQTSKKVKIKCSGVFHCDFSNSIELERAKLPLQKDLVLRCIVVNEDADDSKDVSDDLVRLSHDLETLYQRPLYTDLTLCVGKDKLPVHRAILCIRAPKFAEKLDIQDGEKCKSVISIQNMSLQVLKFLLKYWYTGEVQQPSGDVLLELCKLAKEYELVHLQSELLPIPVHSTVCTRIKYFNEIFNWQIADFCLVKTPLSKIVDLELGRFLVNFNPLASNNSEISFKIISFSKKKKTVYLRAKVSVVDRGGELTNYFDHEYCFESDEITKPIGVISKEKWVFPSQLNNSDLTSDKLKYLPDGILNLRMEFETTEGDKVDEVLEARKVLKKQSSKIAHLPHLSSDFLDIFKVKNRPCVDGEYYDGDCYNDVVLKVGKDEVSCHKFLLGARSPVFSNMLMANAKIKEIKLDISDIDHETLLLLVQYIYSGKLSNVAAIELCKLYTAAEKYKIETLSGRCIVLLEETLSVSNFSDVLIFADEHFSKSLLEATYKYIKSNRNEVLESDEWRRLDEKNNTLTSKVLTSISQGESRHREFYRGFPRGRRFRVFSRGPPRGRK